MTRTTLAALMLLGTPLFALAQGEPAPAPAQDPDAAYNELARDFAKAMNDWQEALQKAMQEAQGFDVKPKATMKQPPTKAFVERALALAGQWAGKDEAVPFLTFVIKSASNERSAVREAVKTLADQHAMSPVIGDVFDHLSNAARFGAVKSSIGLLTDVFEHHSDADTRARALLTRGLLRLERGETGDGAADLRRLAEVTQDEDLLAEAKEALFELERLAIGAEAPDIEGVDTDGVAFKLSDYRGKVVLLDFWGFW